MEFGLQIGFMATGTLLYEPVFRRWAVASLRAPKSKHSIMHVAAVLTGFTQKIAC